MEFEKACNEVCFILDNLNEEDKNKIPEVVIDFFRKNQDLFYKCELTTSKPLIEQELKEETKAFLQILNAKYFSSEDEKKNFIDEINSEINELENNNTSQKNIENEETENTEKSLVVYKENVFKVFLRKIIDFFRKK